MWVSCDLAREECCNWVACRDDIRWMRCERNELSHYTCTNIHEQRQVHAKHDQVSRQRQRPARCVTSLGIAVRRADAMWHSGRANHISRFSPPFVLGKDFKMYMWEIQKKLEISPILFLPFHLLLLYTSTPLHFRGELCTFYSTTFIGRCSDWLLCRVRLFI